MKKKVLCLVMAAAMLVGTPTAAFAEEFTGADGWTVEFDGDNMNSNFTSQEMADEVYGILPGDTMRMQVDVANGSDVQTDWYLSNEILRSLEEGSPAEGGAYTYTLSYYSPSGEETVLFDSDTVGGEGSSPAGEGLQQADSALGDYFYLGRLDSGASGTVAAGGIAGGRDPGQRLPEHAGPAADELRGTQRSTGNGRTAGRGQGDPPDGYHQPEDGRLQKHASVQRHRAGGRRGSGGPACGDGEETP